jgi:drug/metabolite transporter (DMT)-like permease
MSAIIGIAFAAAALLCWGFGDFLLQRSTRKIGDWETLLVVTAFGSAILMPFIFADLTHLSLGDNTFLVLTGVSVVMLFTAIIDFEALKKGKLAVVEPVLALEVPVTALLAFAVVKEGLAALEMLLVTTLIIGIFLVSMKSHHFSRKIWLEKGVLLTLIAATLMGIANFLVGFASRITNPLLTNWFIDVSLLFICAFYIIVNKRVHRLEKHLRENKKLILTVSFFDNFAWICFAVASTLIPIAIAIALSESYIALAALLGLFINKEVLAHHQKIGLVTTLASAIILSVIII